MTKNCLATVVLLMLFLTTGGFVAGQDREPTVAVDLKRPQSMSLGGDLGQQVEAVAKNWLVGLEKRNPQMLGMLEDQDRKPPLDYLPWSGEFAGKHLTACVEVLQVRSDPALLEYTRDLATELQQRQLPNGYLGPFPTEHQLTGWAPNIGLKGGETWDMWGHYHMMLGMLKWYHYSQEDAALGCAVRIANLVHQQFLERGRSVLSTGSPEMNQAILHSLVLLHQTTGSPQYLQQANAIVEEFEVPPAGDYLRTGLQEVPFFKTPKPRWESLHPIMGLAELYWVTGDPRYRDAVINTWWSIVEYDRHNNGGFSSGEQAKGDPYNREPIETCCTIAWAALSVEALRLSDQSVVADELELSLYNQIQALHSRDGRWCTYNTPMDGVRTPSTTDIAFQIRPGSEELNCCSVNAARGFGLLHQWAAYANPTENTLTVNFYGPGSITVSMGENPVALEQTTDYPQAGRINMRLKMENPQEFHLRLRIPHWSHATAVKVNGQSVASVPGEYLQLEREWQNDDVVELDLDLSPRVLVGENSCRDMVSVYQGPLLMAVESAPTAPQFSPDFFAIGGEARASNNTGGTVEYEFHGDTITWLGETYDDAAISRVSIDGALVEEVNQYSDQRGLPFRWSRSGLGPGAHRIRIENTGRRDSNSKGNFMNVFGFEPKSHHPKLQLDQESGEMQLSVVDSVGEKLDLRPYRSVGENGTHYYTWFENAEYRVVPFSPANPSRTQPPTIADSGSH